MYKFHNANAIGNFVNDCVVRSISVAECETWDKTYDKLSDLAQEQGTLLDDVEFVESYLNRNYRPIYHNSITVGEFAGKHPIGTYLITMPFHITVIIDGVVYDTFDCRDREIKGAWVVDKKPSLCYY